MTHTGCAHRQLSMYLRLVQPTEKRRGRYTDVNKSNSLGMGFVHVGVWLGHYRKPQPSAITRMHRSVTGDSRYGLGTYMGGP